MKFSITCAAAILLLSCGTNDSKPSGPSRERIYIQKTDSACFSPNIVLRPGKIQLTTLCYYGWNDSIGATYARRIGGSCLSPLMNFDTGNKNLYYSQSGDSLHIRILRMSPFMPTKVSLDTVFMIQDTLYVGERYDTVGRKQHPGLRFDEVAFDFIIRNTNDKIVFRDISRPEFKHLRQ